MIKLFFIIIASIFSSLMVSSSTYGASCYGISFFQNCDTDKISYCSDGKCDIKEGSNAVSNAVGGFFSAKSISAYVTKIVRYFLTFVTLVAVVYVIYAGVQLMTSAGDEEKSKKSRQIIIYVLIGIVMIWISYWIVALIIDALNGT